MLNPLHDIQATLLRMVWSAGLFGTHRQATKFSQAITRTETHLPVYNQVEHITDAVRVLSWTEDPWGGKLDIIKHPRFMQHSMTHDTKHAGDCDDFANYWIAALLKSKLADDAFLGVCMWRNVEKIEGHACCVFRVGQSWFWVSNWHNHVPLAISEKHGWIDAMMRTVAHPLVVAGRYSVKSITPQDSVVYGQAYRCR